MPELGKKYECTECGAKFYDLGRPEPICPKCGTNQKDKVVEPKRSFVPSERARVAALNTEADEEVAAADDIGEDDDEILEVVPGEDEEEDEEPDDED